MIGVGVGIVKAAVLGGSGGDPFAPPAPALSWVSGSAVVKPKFDMDLRDPTVGDVIRLRRSSSAGMSSPTVYEHTLTAVSACFGCIDFSVSAESDGASYWQLQHERDGHLSAWSEAVTVTVSSVAVPSVPTTMGATMPTRHAFASGFQYAADQYPDVPLNGPEDAGRYVIFGAGGAWNNDALGARIITDADVASGNYAGTAATQIIAAVRGSSNWGMKLFIANIPNGGLARFFLTGVGVSMNIASVCVAPVLAYAINPTPIDAQVAFDGTDGLITTADDVAVAAAMTIPVGGFAIAYAALGNNLTGVTWKNSYASLVQDFTHGTYDHALAKSTTAGSSLAQASRGNFQSIALGAAVFGA